MKGFVLGIIRSINRKLFNIRWYDLRQTKPLSEVFGLDRGLPVDRYYIERFLDDSRQIIRGTVLEIGDDQYSGKFGKGITRQEILHFAEGNPKATMTGDLTDLNTLEAGLADCFICTQTLNFIYDVKAAIRGIHFLLKDGGTALVTVAGISQISRYDMERWGDYWRFTDKSIHMLFSEVFGPENVEVTCQGNVLASIAFLEGISSDELNEDELLFRDENYQILIAVRAIKK